jgi:NAD(P)-dependent dehydrogenase (short-subunit alcohol dehydrogenase family)
MSSIPEFGFKTTAEEAASALSSHIKGKTVLVTGISKGGLGFETARVIALHQPKLLILAGRTPASNDEVAQLIKKESPEVAIKTLQLDLASFAAVRKSAKEVNNWPADIAIDILINNAGIM